MSEERHVSIGCTVCETYAHVTTEHVYTVGDPDPTEPGLQGVCADRFPVPGLESAGVAFACTWEPGHAVQQHVAGTGREIAAVWDVPKPKKRGPKPKVVTESNESTV